MKWLFNLIKLHYSDFFSVWGKKGCGEGGKTHLESDIHGRTVSHKFGDSSYNHYSFWLTEENLWCYHLLCTNSLATSPLNPLLRFSVIVVWIFSDAWSRWRHGVLWTTSLVLGSKHQIRHLVPTCSGLSAWWLQVVILFLRGFCECVWFEINTVYPQPEGCCRGNWKL